MRPRWRLEVEGLGRIERAEVDIHPLMLFVGPNNTGKSYLASLLWGLLAMQGELDTPKGPELTACDEWLTQHLSPDRLPVEHELTEQEIALFDHLFDATLVAERSRLAARVFRDESMTVTDFRFRNTSSPRRARFECLVEQPATGDRPPKYRLTLTDRAGDEEKSFATTTETGDPAMLRAVARDLIMRRLVFFRLTRVFKPFDGTYAGIDPIYLPASRTGFMQLYKAAVQRSFRDALGGKAAEGPWLDLTVPAFHFIDVLAFGLKNKLAPRYADEADLLESALSGTVELLDGGGVNEFRYRPIAAQTALSMSRSSALVTEVAPLVLILRHLQKFPAIILEEPEAHLHPELQRRLAQVVVRLVRKGVYVWITTHSENFCQQINNFMKLGALDPERRAAAQQHLGYGAQDYLEMDDVAGYQFKVDDVTARSSVVEMKKTPYGMAMPTFNVALLRLSEEVDYLDQLVMGE